MRYFKINNSRSFTLLELIVVITIVTVISCLALPNLSKTTERAFEEDALLQLQAIYNVEQTYFSRDNDYYPAAGNTATITEVNDNLVLSILPNGFVYECVNDPPPGIGVFCSATRDSGGYGILIKLDETLTPKSQIWTMVNPNPCCYVLPCPRLGQCL